MYLVKQVNTGSRSDEQLQCAAVSMPRCIMQCRITMLDRQAYHILFNRTDKNTIILKVSGFEAAKHTIRRLWI